MEESTFWVLVFGTAFVISCIFYGIAIHENDTNQLELGGAICDQTKPIHTLEFDKYQDKVLYCKQKPATQSFDGIKIRIGD